jgi:hypothetical protein
VIALLVEKKLNELSYESLRALREYIKDRTNLDLFGTDAAFEETLLASEIRNLIAHNDCVLNSVFTKKTEGIDLPLPVSNKTIQITDEWLRRTSYTLDRVVFRFDELASEKFGLTVHDSAEILKSGKLPRQVRHVPVPPLTEADQHQREDPHRLKITTVRRQDEGSAFENWRVHQCSGGYIKKRD